MDQPTGCEKLTDLQVGRLLAQCLRDLDKAPPEKRAGIESVLIRVGWERMTRRMTRAAAELVARGEPSKVA